MILLSKIKLSLALGATALAIAGCGASYPVPNDRMASSESSVRGAEEVGANNDPQASLHLKLAQENIAQAKVLIANQNNEEADDRLTRAGAEAELALSLAKANTARADAQAAINEVTKLKAQAGTN